MFGYERAATQTWVVLQLRLSETHYLPPETTPGPRTEARHSSENSSYPSKFRFPNIKLIVKINIKVNFSTHYVINNILNVIWDFLYSVHLDFLYSSSNTQICTTLHLVLRLSHSTIDMPWDNLWNSSKYVFRFFF